MSRIGVLLIVWAWAASPVSAQLLIKETTKPISKAVQQGVDARKAFTDVRAVDIDLSQLQTSSVKISLFGRQTELSQIRLEKRQEDDYSWFGLSSDGLSQIALSVKRSDIQAVVTIDDQLYNITSIQGEHIVAKVDQSNLPPESCFDRYRTGVREQSGNGNTNPPVADRANENEGEDPIGIGDLEPGQLDGPCTIRVLVLYTPETKDEVGGKDAIENLAQLSVDVTNLSYLRSNIFHSTTLVFVDEATSNGTGNTRNDLNNFETNQDGYIDEVHQLRVHHGADVCALIANNSDACGRAGNIKSCADQSFFIVDWTCSVVRFSFAHEIGHLAGAVHDRTSNPLTVPYLYGHGYVESGKTWRTIMALPSSCSNCNRLLWWSSPNTMYAGQAMGTIQFEDNVRLLNTYIPNLMSHRPMFGQRVVQQQDIFSIVATIYHPVRVVTSGSVALPSDGNWQFLAGENVELNLGFDTNGADFDARLRETCGVPDGEPCNLSPDGDPWDQDPFIGSERFLFTAYPNPVNRSFILNVGIGEPCADLEVCMVNMMGAEVLKQKLQTGKNNITLPEDTQNGIYLAQLRVGGQVVKTSKLIVE